MRRLFMLHWKLARCACRSLEGRCRLYYLLAFLSGALPAVLLSAVLGADAVSIVCAAGCVGLFGFFAAYVFALRNL